MTDQEMLCVSELVKQKQWGQHEKAWWSEPAGGYLVSDNWEGQRQATNAPEKYAKTMFENNLLYLSFQPWHPSV